MATKRRTEEFFTHYDRLSKVYGDPVQVLFEIAFDQRNSPGDRRQAASDLCSYRYPKQKAVDLNVEAGAGGLTFVMIGPQQVGQVLTAQQEFASLPSRLLLDQEEIIDADDV